jgi:putative glycerol-1-phosphate prenyltransferase
MLSQDITIYNKMLRDKSSQKKNFVVLLDPDKCNDHELDKVIKLSIDAHVDYFFVGGSLLMHSNLDRYLDRIKEQSQIPTILFPGNTDQITCNADAILYLSLISGRNPNLLIGKHVESAMKIKKSGLEVIPTGYMIIDGGRPTSVSYISNTSPIPQDKNGIAVSTAIAGELLGLKLIYLEAGSGAINAVSPSMIEAVSQHTNVPLIVGGGIRTPEKATQAIEAGADIIVIGNAIEKDPNLIIDMSAAIHSAKTIIQ